MTGARARAAAAAAIAVAAAGCGLGEGEASEGEASLRVTRDYGAELMAAATSEDPHESDSVIRLLDREAEITTRYGGGFVQSIEGAAGEVSAGRSYDWFFFVNGIESSVGAAEVPVRAGDRIWWDRRDWTDAMRVPAVVGSWPQPFAGGGAEVECEAAAATCETVSERLAEAGAGEDERASGGDPPRVLVGEWARIRSDPVAGLIARGPGASGVFARFEGAAAGGNLVALDVSARPVARLGPGWGLVAATARGNDPPTWLVTGTDADGTDAAAQALSEDLLRDRYALVVGDDRPFNVPVVEGPAR